MMNMISPKEVLDQISRAIPETLHKNITIIGSLAAGYYFFGNNPDLKVHTKDVDCLLSPQFEAISAGREVVDKLFTEKWEMRSDVDWGTPGNATTPDNQLPVVRLYPPGSKDWFVEFLTVSPQENNARRIDNRLETSHGHFNLCSFPFLALSQFNPIKTKFGISIARPEIMALANLLGHKKIGPETMSGLISGRKIKRSNKDLGRVLAIAHLSLLRDEYALLKWPDIWIEALQKYYPLNWEDLTQDIGKGLEQLLENPYDLEEAHYTCVNGLLASNHPTLEQFQIDGQRVLLETIEVIHSNSEKDFGMGF